MSWQKIALIASVVWFVGVFACGMIHTGVVLAGQLNEAQEEALAQRYGFVAGFGLPILWGIAFAVAKLRRSPPTKVD